MQTTVPASLRGACSTTGKSQGGASDGGSRGIAAGERPPRKPQEALALSEPFKVEAAALVWDSSHRESLRV